jgi:predicted ABC-type exoprotein transport system permease subunit
MSSQPELVCDTHRKRVSITSCLTCGKRLCEPCVVIYRGMDYCIECAPQGHEPVNQILPLLPADRMVESHGQRGWIAGYVDAMLGLMASTLLVWVLIGHMSQAATAVCGTIMLLFAAVLAPAWNLAVTGRTIGNHCTGTIVLRKNGTPLTFVKAIQRTGIRFLCVLLGIPVLQVVIKRPLCEGIDALLECATYMADGSW